MPIYSLDSCGKNGFLNWEFTEMNSLRGGRSSRINPDGIWFRKEN